MQFSILFGGKAGQGPNFLTNLLGKILVDNGYYVFYAREYQSLIRGGHNFNVLTFSEKPVYSNESKVDVIVALDEKTEEIHGKNLKKGGIILKKGSKNVYYAGKLFNIFNLDFKDLEKELKSIGERVEENIQGAKKGYDEAEKTIEIPKPKQKKLGFINGTQGISQGAIDSGLDIYFAYPMTPATPLLGELAKNQIKDKRVTLELENEIAVANAGVGSSITGAKTMIGTSGGGFDLMTETLSMTGEAEIPLIFYLAQRGAPGTGVATYTMQGDLHQARHSGHGEFNRLVLAPGDPTEAAELTNHAVYFSQKFSTPVIILSDKHLGESFYTTDRKPEIKKVKKQIEFGRYNSYEQNPETGSATEDPKIITNNFDKRNKKKKEIQEEAKNFDQYKVYGKKTSKNIVISWGSTKGAILDAIDCFGDEKGKNTKFLQILHIEPFPEKIKSILEKAKKIILIENNSTGQLADLIREKTGIKIPEKNKILRYDARPFLSDELKKEIKKKI